MENEENLKTITQALYELYILVGAYSPKTKKYYASALAASLPKEVEQRVRCMAVLYKAGLRLGYPDEDEYAYGTEFSRPAYGMAYDLYQSIEDGNFKVDPDSLRATFQDMSALGIKVLNANKDRSYQNHSLVVYSHVIDVLKKNPKLYLDTVKPLFEKLQTLGLAFTEVTSAAYRQCANIWKDDSLEKRNSLFLFFGINYINASEDQPQTIVFIIKHFFSTTSSV